MSEKYWIKSHLINIAQNISLLAALFNVISVSSATRSRLRRLKWLDNYIIMLEPQLNLAHAFLHMKVCFSTFLSGAPNSVCHFSWLSIDMIVVKHKNSFMWVGAWGTINRIKWHVLYFWERHWFFKWGDN